MDLIRSQSAVLRNPKWFRCCLVPPSKLAPPGEVGTSFKWASHLEEGPPVCPSASDLGPVLDVDLPEGASPNWKSHSDSLLRLMVPLSFWCAGFIDPCESYLIPNLVWRDPGKKCLVQWTNSQPQKCGWVRGAVDCRSASSINQPDP